MKYLPSIHWVNWGGGQEKKSKETCKRVKKDYYLATWFDSIYTLRFEVMWYLMTTSNLLCLTGTCPAQFINVCWCCWSTHWGPCVSLALRKWKPFLPQQDLSWPTSFSPFSASPISCFLFRDQAGERDHLGGLYFILLKEGSTLSSDYVVQGFIQKSDGIWWTTCVSVWLHSPWCDSLLTSCSDVG